MVYILAAWPWPLSRAPLLVFQAAELRTAWTRIATSASAANKFFDRPDMGSRPYFDVERPSGLGATQQRHAADSLSAASNVQIARRPPLRACS